MKKLTLSVGLLAGILTSNAQDTTCTYFSGNIVHEFNYQTNEIIKTVENESKYYDIHIKYGDVLCLDLSDKKLRMRKVILTFFDGQTLVEVLDSKDDVYYTPFGVVKVSVGKPRTFFLGCR
tara:strand:+ start:505 stop:867 length:363 start_codon:yes stop_codon:yes gene_type:complete